MDIHKRLLLNFRPAVTELETFLKRPLLHWDTEIANDPALSDPALTGERLGPLL